MGCGVGGFPRVMPGCCRPHAKQGNADSGLERIPAPGWLSTPQNARPQAGGSAGLPTRAGHGTGWAAPGTTCPETPPKSLRPLKNPRDPPKSPETPPKSRRPPQKKPSPQTLPPPPGGRSAEAHGRVPPRGRGGHAGTHRSPPTEAATALPGPARLGTALPGSARRREGSGMWLWEVAFKEQPRGRAPRSPTHPTRVLSPPSVTQRCAMRAVALPGSVQP